MSAIGVPLSGTDSDNQIYTAQIRAIITRLSPSLMTSLRIVVAGGRRRPEPGGHRLIHQRGDGHSARP
jgi:hypothetical protein